MQLTPQHIFSLIHVIARIYLINLYPASMVVSCFIYKLEKLSVWQFQAKLLPSPPLEVQRWNPHGFVILNCITPHAFWSHLWIFSGITQFIWDKKIAYKVTVFHLCYSEAIRSLESENEELMKDNTLAGSIQNQNQVLTLGRPSVYDRLALETWITCTCPQINNVIEKCVCPVIKNGVVQYNGLNTHGSVASA